MRFLRCKWRDPQQVFEALFVNSPYAFWLDSARPGPQSRYSYMGRATQVKEGLPEDSFTGTWVGYVGYDETPDYPIGMMMKADCWVTFDHENRQIEVQDPGLKQAIEALPSFFDIKLGSLGEGSCHEVTEGSSLDPDLKTAYLSKIDTIQRFIREGEIYEACLTQAFKMPYTGSDFKLYKTLRQINPAPYAAYIQTPAFSILSSSPERFLSVTQEGSVTSEPIKGTRKKGRTKAETQAQMDALLASEKERAELVMITDLIRNDLAKTAEVGSVRVPIVCQVTEYETLLQLSSVITSQLAPAYSRLDVFKSCFPGGSISGAPKIRALDILHAVENRPRGVYTGCIGFVSDSGVMQWNIAIRTLVVHKEKGWVSFGSGGAITADSDPEKEYEEMRLKARPLFRAIDGCLAL